MNTKEKVTEIIIKIKGDESVIINDSTRMINDLNFDSLMFVELVVAIEESFHFVFDDDYLKSNKIDKVKDLVQYVEEKVYVNE